MGKDLVQVEILERVMIITLNNPPANALSTELKEEFISKLVETSKADDVWTLIITGAGEKFFVAGGNIPELLELDRNSGLERVERSREFFGCVASLEKPVIAAINGMCMGGGLELALACDIRVAADHIKLGMPEVNLGLIPGGGGTQRLPRAIGPGWANYLLFTGVPVSAEKALKIGLIQSVVPIEALRKTALKIAHSINRNGPLAVRAAKRVSSHGLQISLEKGLDIENEAFAECCATEDKKEGLTAFLEKRKPRFHGK